MNTNLCLLISLSELFEPRACANLKGKPKIFFIQSCRGQKPSKPIEDVKLKPHKPKSEPHKPEDVKSEPHKPEDVKSEQQPSLTRKLDFYFSYATDPGHCSKQKLYLRFLSETLNELSAECSLDNIITHVHRKVAAENGNVKIGDDVYQHQQAPQVVQQMRGPVYFQ